MLTRDAFMASLQLENSTDGYLTDISVDIVIEDMEGQDVTSLFGINSPILQNISATDGSGLLSPDSTGKAIWSIIPNTDSVTNVEGEIFYVGGALSYSDQNNSVLVPLSPVIITVYPQPELDVQYFHQRDVYADDPWTEEIEPSEPFDLAVMVTNQGYGSARNLMIESGWPEVISNDKGLLLGVKFIRNSC